MRGIIISPEARAFVKKMRVQPEDCTKVHAAYVQDDWRNSPSVLMESSTNKGYWYCRHCGSGIEHSKGKGIKAPYTVGERLYIKEPWIDTDHSGNPLEFHPARTMPINFAAKFRDVTKVEAVRVKDMTDEQIVNIVSHDFNSRTYTKGKRDCFNGTIITQHGHTAWDENHFVWYVEVKEVGNE